MTTVLSSSLLSLSSLAYYGPGYGYGMGGSAFYWLVLIGTMVLSGIAAARVRSAYAHYSQVPASSGITGAQLAQRIAHQHVWGRCTGHQPRGEGAGPRLILHHDPRGQRMIAADVGGGDFLESRDVLAGPTAWLFGNEARGLEEDALALADLSLRLPIYGAAESLNLATAASVCLYETAFAQRAAR